MILLLLQEMIHGRYLGDVFCDVVKSLEVVQQKVMLKPSPNNPLKPCNDPTRGKIDFEALVDHILLDYGRQAAYKPFAQQQVEGKRPINFKQLLLLMTNIRQRQQNPIPQLMQQQQEVLQQPLQYQPPLAMMPNQLPGQPQQSQQRHQARQ